MGTELAGRGQWEAAAAEFARAFADTPPNEPWLCFEYAILLLAVADAQGYRSTRQYMLATLGKTKDLTWLQFTAHACVLASGPPAEANEALRLAERVPGHSQNTLVRPRPRAGALLLAALPMPSRCSRTASNASLAEAKQPS